MLPISILMLWQKVKSIFILITLLFTYAPFHKPIFIITQFYNYHYILTELYNSTKIQPHIYNSHIYKSPPINIPTASNPRAHIGMQSTNWYSLKLQSSVSLRRQIRSKPMMPSTFKWYHIIPYHITSDRAILGEGWSSVDGSEWPWSTLLLVSDRSLLKQWIALNFNVIMD